MDAVTEYLTQIIGQLRVMAEKRDQDIERLRGTINDWMRRDHEITVRRAQFILEAADLERTRMMLIRELSLLEAQKNFPIVRVDGV